MKSKPLNLSKKRRGKLKYKDRFRHGSSIRKNLDGMHSSMALEQFKEMLEGATFYADSLPEALSSYYNLMGHMNHRIAQAKEQESLGSYRHYCEQEGLDGAARALRELDETVDAQNEIIEEQDNEIRSLRAKLAAFEASNAYYRDVAEGERRAQAHYRQIGIEQSRRDDDKIAGLNRSLYYAGQSLGAAKVREQALRFDLSLTKQERASALYQARQAHEVAETMAKQVRDLNNKLNRPGMIPSFCQGLRKRFC